MKKILATILIFMLLCTGCQGKENVTTSPTINPDPERTNVKNNAKIIVYKSERKLEVYDDDKLVATMKIGLGFTPEGHKQREGDGKTPEGEYYICTRNSRSRYFLSVGLSYPNIDDATAGLEREAISQDEFDDIKSMIDTGECPPWKTPLGGEIMIHGERQSLFEQPKKPLTVSKVTKDDVRSLTKKGVYRDINDCVSEDISHRKSPSIKSDDCGAFERPDDWTAGCVAVENVDMQYIWDNCQLGTSVIIKP